MKFNLNRVYALVLRHLITWPRSWERIADSFWWPTMNLFIWGLVNTYLQQKTDTTGFFAGLLLGGLIMWTLVSRSQEEMGILFLQEAWDRNLLNIFSSPITIWEFSAATILLSSAKLVFTFLWMFLLSLLLFSFNILDVGWMLIPYALVLSVSGWWLGFIINSLIFLYGYRVQVFAWTLTLIIMPFVAVYYPVSALPPWMQTVSWWLPPTYVFEGMRAILAGYGIDLMGLGKATLLNAVYIGASVYFFAKSYQKAKDTGMIMKFS